MQKTIQERFNLKVHFCNHIINVNHFVIGQQVKVQEIPLHKGNLFLGGVGSFKQAVINNYRITSVLSILDEQFMKRNNIREKCEHFNILKHKWIDMQDEEDSDIYQHFEDSHKFIKDALKQHNLLIHCQVGVSRSASIVIAFLIKEYKLKYTEAFNIVSKRRIVRPNDGFVKALLKYQQQLFGQKK